MAAVAISLGSGMTCGGLSYGFYIGALGVLVGWQFLLIPCALSFAVAAAITYKNNKEKKKLEDRSRPLARMIVLNIESLSC